MWLFYVLSIIPLIIGGILWIRDKEIVWWEWAISAAIGFIIAILFHIIAFKGMTDDVETWSGQVDHVIYYPTWIEREDRIVTDYDSKGRPCGSHIETDYTTHYRHWTAYSNIDTERDIDESTYHLMCSEFGGRIETVLGNKPGFDSGDRYIYPCYDETGFCVPVHDTFHFTNRVKASPSLFSFVQPPKESPAFPYPKNKNWFASERLLGTAKEHINLLAWDKMNARLGPSKKVNVIMVGFPEEVGMNAGMEQQAKWIGGKKNDLVICYGGGSKTEKPVWVYIFGWSDSELAKQDIQSFVLAHPVNNSLIQPIEDEIQKNYVKKNWHQFDYLSIEPPTIAYVLYFFFMALTQLLYYVWAFHNNYEQTSWIGRTVYSIS